MGREPVDIAGTEIAGVDEHLAKHALASAEIKRLMTIPGVDVTTAATLRGVIGDIRRFESAKRLVGYLGLDARVRQSGVVAARHGRISKEGTSAARHVLVQAAWAAIKTPGPLRAFYQRVKARRGAQIAIVAVARKLAMLCWQLLTRQQDYAYPRPHPRRAQAPHAGTARRRRARENDVKRASREHGQAARRAGTPARRTGRARLPASHRRLESNRPEQGCGRRTGARITRAVKRPRGAAGTSPRT